MSESGGDPTDMSKIKILHAADLHLDSPFEALSAGKAAIRRQEQRQLLSSLAELAVREDVDLVLLSGDLLDSSNTYYETGEELIRSLQEIQAPVFIAPGNHDFYSPKSPYARLQLPENVHIFREKAIRFVSLPRLNARVYGAAFTENQSGPLLRDFHAERKEGVWNLLCLHGEVGNRDSVYDPISLEDLAQSGMDYAALGHIHKASGLQKAGKRRSEAGNSDGYGQTDNAEQVNACPDGNAAVFPAALPNLNPQQNGAAHAERSRYIRNHRSKLRAGGNGRYVRGTGKLADNP